MTEADSEEYREEHKENVIIFMPEISKTHKGGTMRLGTRTTYVRDPDSLAAKVYYGEQEISERHRHRYEVNCDFKADLEAKGMVFSGEDINKERMEVLELKDHEAFFLGVQYHPEFTSRPFSPNPCFYAFILASSGQVSEIGSRSEFETVFRDAPDDLSQTSLE